MNQMVIRLPWPIYSATRAPVTTNYTECIFALKMHFLTLPNHPHHLKSDKWSVTKTGLAPEGKSLILSKFT